MQPHKTYILMVTLLVLGGGCSSLSLYEEKPKDTKSIENSSVPKNDLANDPLALKADPAAELALKTMPELKDVELRNMIIQFSSISKAFWLNYRCKFLDQAQLVNFTRAVGNSNNILRILIASEFQISPEEADKKNQAIQMYALQSVSANGFYGCKEQAQQLFNIGYQESMRWDKSIGDILLKK